MADSDQSLNILRYNQVTQNLEAFGGGTPSWTLITLNNVDPTQVPTTRLINTTAPLTGGGDLSANRTLSIPAATGLVNGYLLATDWTTFNGKQAAGSYITALTGDVTASGPGSATATLASTAVTPGSYTISSLTVDAKGRLTAASSATTTGSGSVVLSNAPTFTGIVTSSTGNINITSLGSTVGIKEGANAKMGTSVLVGGTVVVSTTAVAANSRIFLTSQVDGGAPGFLRVSTRTAGTSFTITSGSGTDTSTVAWVILDPQ